MVTGTTRTPDREGASCGHIVVGGETSPSFIRLEQRVAIEESASSFRLSAWVRSSGTGNGKGVYASVSFIGEKNRPLPNQSPGSGPEPEAIGEWKRVTVEGAIPAAAKRAIVRLLIHGSGEVFWDDVSLETSPEGERAADMRLFLKSLLPVSPLSPDERARIEFGSEAKVLGRISPFWRAVPRPDANMDDPRRRSGTLVRLPDWLREHPGYRNWETSRRTVIFGDTLSAVRLLGGWNREPHGQYDLAFRRNGGIEYRWDLLRGRLDPWVEQGLDVLVVLDNVPFAFVSEPKFNTYGQVMGPDESRLEEYGEFIRKLTGEMIRNHGRERVSNWRFRVGTEPDLPGHWEDSVEKFCMMYDHAAAAVLSVLPEARIGPGNFLSPRGVVEAEAMQIMEHIAHGRNHATGESGAPVHFLAGSLYAVPKARSGHEQMMRDASPEKVRLLAWKLKKMRSIDPRFAQLPIEIHEFGTLFTELSRNEDEKMCAWAGMQGAAWVHQAYAAALDEGFSEVFFWFNHDNIPGREEPLLLLRGYGWVRGMLEFMAGGQWFLLPVAEPQGEGTTTIRAFASVKEEALWIALSSFDLGRAEGDQPVRIEIDGSQTPFLDLGSGEFEIREFRQTAANCAYDVIRADLAREGMLAIDNGAVYSIRRLATAEGMRYVKANREKYEELLRRSFLREKFKGTAEVVGDTLVVETDLTTPSVVFLEVKRR